MTEIFLPGDLLQPTSSSGEQIRIIGCGIDKTKSGLMATQPGILRKKDGKMFMSMHIRRYIPETGDRVLGVVTGKMGDSWKVDIGSAHFGLVHFMQFEGASKRNRPEIKSGDLIYAQVTRASRHMETELTCVDSEFRSRGMGKLVSGGVVFRVPIHVVRTILNPESQLLKLLGKEIKFEIVCGVNGRVWIRADERKNVILARNAILRSEFVTSDKLTELVTSEINQMRRVGTTMMDTN